MINQEGEELTKDEQLVRILSPGIILHLNFRRSAEILPKTLRIISACADGVLAPRLRTLDGSASPPIDTIGNLQAHMSAESPLNISLNLSEVISEVTEQ